MWKLNGLTRAAFWNTVLALIFRVGFLRRLRFLVPAATAGVMWYLGRRKGAADANVIQGTTVQAPTEPNNPGRKSKVKISS